MLQDRATLLLSMTHNTVMHMETYTRLLKICNYKGARKRCM